MCLSFYLLLSLALLGVSQINTECFFPNAEEALLALIYHSTLLHPKAQQRAWDKINASVGWDQLLTFEDHPKLPFVNAMCKEVMRWRPVAPLGMSVLYQ